jgi:hypothetical protein
VCKQCELGIGLRDEINIYSIKKISVTSEVTQGKSRKKKLQTNNKRISNKSDYKEFLLF